MESKTLSMIKIFILSVIAVVLILIFVVLLYRPSSFGFFSFERNIESKLVYDEVYDDEITSLYLNSISGYIEVNESDEDKVSLKIYGKDKDKIDVNVVDGKLSVIENYRSVCIGFCFNTSYRIIVNVPKEKEYDMEIKTTSGDLNVGNISTKKAIIKTVSGEINLYDLDDATVESVSGDIRISNVNNINVKTVSGEIYIESINGKCKLKTTSGDVEIGKLNITKDSTINTISGDVEIGSNNSYIKTNTVSGDVDIKNNDRYATVETSISTTSGDIEVGD